MQLRRSEALLLQRLDAMDESVTDDQRAALLSLIEMNRLQAVLQCEYVTVSGRLTEAGRRAYEEALKI